MKRVPFTSKRPSEAPLDQVDNWVAGVDPNEPEPTKRLTIDVPVSLHRRMKLQSALEGGYMADKIREVLERRFPQRDEGSRNHDAS